MHRTCVLRKQAHLKQQPRTVQVKIGAWIQGEAVNGSREATRSPATLYSSLGRTAHTCTQERCRGKRVLLGAYIETVVPFCGSKALLQQPGPNKLA